MRYVVGFTPGKLSRNVKSLKEIIVGVAVIVISAGVLFYLGMVFGVIK